MKELSEKHCQSGRRAKCVPVLCILYSFSVSLLSFCFSSLSLSPCVCGDGQRSVSPISTLWVSFSLLVATAPSLYTVSVLSPFLVCATCGCVGPLQLLAVMMNVRLLALVALAALFATVCAGQASADVPTPLVFVAKTTSSSDIVLGASVDVVVTVYNYGQSPAFDVVITDELEDGTKQERHFDSIPYSGAESLRYTVTPKSLGPYPVGAATVTYNLEQGNAETSQTAYSSIVREDTAYYRGEGHDDVSVRGTVSVLTRERYNRLHTRHIKEMVAYICLGLMPAAFPYFFYHSKQAQVDKLLHRSKRSK